MRRLELLGEVLNSPPEIHAFVIGLACGVIVAVTGRFELAVFLWAVLVGGRGLTGHLCDARKEMAYTVAGFAGGWSVAVIAVT